MSADVDRKKVKLFAHFEVGFWLESQDTSRFEVISRSERGNRVS